MDRNSKNLEYLENFTTARGYQESHSVLNGLPLPTGSTFIDVEAVPSEDFQNFQDDNLPQDPFLTDGFPLTLVDQTDMNGEGFSLLECYSKDDTPAISEESKGLFPCSTDENLQSLMWTPLQDHWSQNLSNCSNDTMCLRPPQRQFCILQQGSNQQTSGPTSHRRQNVPYSLNFANSVASNVDSEVVGYQCNRIDTQKSKKRLPTSNSGTSKSAEAEFFRLKTSEGTFILKGTPMNNANVNDVLAAATNLPSVSDSNATQVLQNENSLECTPVSVKVRTNTKSIQTATNSISCRNNPNREKIIKNTSKRKKSTSIQVSSLPMYESVRGASQKHLDTCALTSSLFFNNGLCNSSTIEQGAAASLLSSSTELDNLQVLLQDEQVNQVTSAFSKAKLWQRSPKPSRAMHTSTDMASFEGECSYDLGPISLNEDTYKYTMHTEQEADQFLEKYGMVQATGTSSSSSSEAQTKTSVASSAETQSYLSKLTPNVSQANEQLYLPMTTAGQYQAAQANEHLHLPITTAGQSQAESQLPNMTSDERSRLLSKLRSKAYNAKQKEFKEKLAGEVDQLEERNKKLLEKKKKMERVRDKLVKICHHNGLNWPELQ